MGREINTSASDYRLT